MKSAAVMIDGRRTPIARLGDIAARLDAFLGIDGRGRRTSSVIHDWKD